MADNPILAYSDTVVYDRNRLPFQGTDGQLTRAAEAVVGAVGDAASRGLQTELSSATDQFVAEAQAQQAALEAPLTDDVIGQALGASADEVSRADAAVKPVLHQLARLKLAQEQGAIDASELAIRHEDILRSAVQRHPAFASQLIQAAGETLGYNPIGAELEALEAEMRSASGAGGGQKNEIEEYYDKQADALSIDRTQKWSDPVGYYSKVQREIALNEETQRSVRLLGQLSTTRQISEEQSFELARTDVFPKLYSRFVAPIVNQARQFMRQDASGTGQAIESGARQAFQAEIIKAKQGITQAILSSPMGQYLTPERIAAAVAPLNSMLDEAASSTDPAKALTYVKQVLEAQTLNRVDLRNPDIGMMRALMADIGKLPAGSLIAGRVEAGVADSVALALTSAYGFEVDGQPYPTAVVPGRRTPATVQATEKARQIFDTLSTTDDMSPESARAMLRAFGGFANEARTDVQGGRGSPARRTVRGWMTTMSSDKWLENAQKAGAAEAEIALAGYTDMFREEAVDIGADIADGLAGADVRYYTNMVNPSGRQGLERNRKVPGSAPLRDMVLLSWGEGKVNLVANPDANPNLNISGDSLNRGVAAMKPMVEAHATTLVKATAHQLAAMSGSPPNYELALEVLMPLILAGDIGALNYNAQP